MFTKKDIVERLVKDGNLNPAQAERILNLTLEAVSDELTKGSGKVTLTGFGTFEVKERAARNGVNPATHEKIQIPASKTVGFHVSHVIKDKLN